MFRKLIDFARAGTPAAANKPPLCISPDAEVTEAITLMLQHDFSQLPVTTTERDVKGLSGAKSAEYEAICICVKIHGGSSVSVSIVPLRNI